MSASSSAPSKRRRNRLHNCDTWAELDPDLLLSIAGFCHGGALAALPQVCQSWRDAFTEDSSNVLWEKLVRAHYPRAFAILNLLKPETRKYKDIYIQNLEAEKEYEDANVQPPPSCKLEDFIFTVELVSDYPKSASDVIEMRDVGARTRRQSAIIETIEKLPDPTIVRSWTGTLAGLQAPDDTVFSLSSPVDFKVPMKWSEWKRTWRSEPNYTPTKERMRLRVLVSRVLDGRLRTLPIFLSEDMPDESDRELGIHTMSSEALRYTHSHPFEERDADLVPELAIDLLESRVDENNDNEVTEHMRLGFRMYIVDCSVENMQEEDLPRYLEYCLPW